MNKRRVIRLIIRKLLKEYDQKTEPALLNEYVEGYLDCVFRSGFWSRIPVQFNKLSMHEERMSGTKKELHMINFLDNSLGTSIWVLKISRFLNVKCNNKHKYDSNGNYTSVGELFEFEKYLSRLTYKILKENGHKDIVYVEPIVKNKKEKYVEELF